MIAIKDWKAKRAGGRITIYGKTAEGADIRVAGVDCIEAYPADTPVPEGARGAPVATDKTGAKYVLI